MKLKRMIMPAYKKVNVEHAPGRTPEDYKRARSFLNKFTFLNGHEIEVLLEIAKVLGDDVSNGSLPHGTLSQVAQNMGLTYEKTVMVDGTETKKEYPHSPYVHQLKERAAKKVLQSFFTIYLMHSMGLMYITIDDLQKELNNCKKEFQKAYINTLDPTYDLNGEKIDRFLHAIMTHDIEEMFDVIENPPESPFIKRTEEKLQKKHEELAAYNDVDEQN
jgi:hypothetical protein